MVEQDELLDLVNINDEVVGTVMREEHHAHDREHTKAGHYFRGTAALLVNSKKQLWIPTRQPHRKVAPSSLDFSMAEHVMSGESHVEAAVRGMEEELHMRVKPSDLELVDKKVFDDFGCMMTLFLYRTDEEPDYSVDDYQFGEWLSLAALEQRILSGALYKSALPQWVEVLKTRGL